MQWPVIYMSTFGGLLRIRPCAQGSRRTTGDPEHRTRVGQTAGLQPACPGTPYLLQHAREGATHRFHAAQVHRGLCGSGISGDNLCSTFRMHYQYTCTNLICTNYTYFSCLGEFYYTGSLVFTALKHHRGC